LNLVWKHFDKVLEIQNLISYESLIPLMHITLMLVMMMVVVVVLLMMMMMVI